LQRRSLGLQGVMPHYVLVLPPCEPHAPHYLLVLQLCESQCLLGLQPHAQCCGTNDVVAEAGDGAFWDREAGAVRDRETEEVREREAEEVREREAPRTPQGLADQVEM
jgi:hypothetical protein